MGQRKARFAAAACMVSISLMLGACKSGVPADSAPKAAETGQEELKLVFWHYYNDAQKQYLDRLIKEYNETEGAGKHVVVEASSQGSIGDLTNKIDLALSLVIFLNQTVQVLLLRIIIIMPEYQL